jgi:hypothetical protein
VAHLVCGCGGVAFRAARCHDLHIGGPQEPVISRGLDHLITQRSLVQIQPPATIDNEGLADAAPLTPFVYPDFTQELDCRVPSKRGSPGRSVEAPRARGRGGRASEDAWTRGTRTAREEASTPTVISISLVLLIAVVANGCASQSSDEGRRRVTRPELLRAQAERGILSQSDPLRGGLAQASPPL